MWKNELDSRGLVILFRILQKSVVSTSPLFFYLLIDASSAMSLLVESSHIMRIDSEMVHRSAGGIGFRIHT